MLLVRFNCKCNWSTDWYTKSTRHYIAFKIICKTNWIQHMW